MKENTNLAIFVKQKRKLAKKHRTENLVNNRTDEETK